MEKKTQKSWLTPRVFLFFGCIILTSLIHYGAYKINYLSKRLELKDNMVKSLNDSLRVKGNSARISRIETHNVKEVLKESSSDSLFIQLQEAIKRLEKEVKANGSSITSFETKLKTTGSSKTEVVKKDSTVSFKSNFKDEWINLTTESNKDSTKFDLEVTNKYNVILGYERKSFFSKPKPFVEVEDLNKYSNVTGIRSVSVKDTRPKLEFKWNVGVGANYDMFSQRFGFGPYGGFGLTF